MRRDDAYLLDMLVAARKAVTFTEELTYAQFVQSDLHQNAVLKVLEIVGEGASRVGERAEILPGVCNAYLDASTKIRLITCISLLGNMVSCCPVVAKISEALRSK